MENQITKILLLKVGHLRFEIYSPWNATTYFFKTISSGMVTPVMFEITGTILRYFAVNRTIGTIANRTRYLKILFFRNIIFSDLMVRNCSKTRLDAVLSERRSGDKVAYA